jgi:hypothetical protein
MVKTEGSFIGIFNDQNFALDPCFNNECRQLSLLSTFIPIQASTLGVPPVIDIGHQGCHEVKNWLSVLKNLSKMFYLLPWERIFLSL